MKFNTYYMNSESNKPLVMIVEDNVVLCESLIYLLKLHGYQTIEANSGKQALEMLTLNIPDIILIDIMLDDSTDGFAVLRFIKNDSRFKFIPVIIISALKDETNILCGLELGANDYITKPFKVKELIMKISNLIKLKDNIKEYLTKGGSLQSTHTLGSNTYDEHLLKSFALLIENNLSTIDKQYIKEIAVALNLSVSSLERLVKKHYGCNPIQYIVKRKIEKSNLLLKYSNKTVMEISVEMGFNSLSYFSTCYKKHFGHSPLKSRKI